MSPKWQCFLGLELWNCKWHSQNVIAKRQSTIVFLGCDHHASMLFFVCCFSVVELTFDNLRTFFSERKTSTPQNSSAASTPQRMSTDFLDTMQGTNVDMGSIDNGPETPTPSDELVPSLHEALNTDILTDVEAILSPNRIDNNFLTWL